MEELSLESLLMVIARGIVSNPDAIKVDVNESLEEGIIKYHLYVDSNDIGRIIGKQGRIARAIRQIVRSVAARRNIKISLEIS